MSGTMVAWGTERSHKAVKAKVLYMRGDWALTQIKASEVGTWALPRIERRRVSVTHIPTGRRLPLAGLTRERGVRIVDALQNAPRVRTEGDALKHRDAIRECVRMCK